MKMTQKIGRGSSLLGEVERVLIPPPEDPFFFLFFFFNTYYVLFLC